jgi:shikimate dehydrogenase
MSASAKHKICLVIGDPVAHSLSPSMHNAAYKALGIEAEYEFGAKRIVEDELAKFMYEVREKDIHMLAVTIPHKEAIMQYLDAVDNVAKEIGAVNMVLNKDGKLIGYNTDYVGAVESLRAVVALIGKRVSLLGSGGSARAIVYGLVKEKCDVTVYSRNKDSANELKKTFGCKVLPWEERNSMVADIIVNTTPIGRDNNVRPIDESVIHKGQIVFDINYNANGTSLLKLAKKKGTTAVDGLEMLLKQGMKQFELYTGIKAPEQAMRKALQNDKERADAI